jgi:hypothetical protein
MIMKSIFRIKPHEEGIPGVPTTPSIGRKCGGERMKGGLCNRGS